MSARKADWEGRYEAIYRFVRRRAASREDAEDVTQEVFASAVRALAEARLTEEAPAVAWLYTVARRRLADRLRREYRQPLVSDSAISTSEDERLYGPAIVRALRDGLRELDDQQRQVVVLKLFEGRKFAEIAAIVGASEQACRARFSRGLASLRAYLAEKGVTP